MNHRHEFTPHQLVQAGRDVVAPFGLLLHSANLGQLDVESVLRLLPAKRLTALARWHGKKVIVKLFVDPSRWRTHWQEEMDGHEALVAAHIPTPKLLSSEQHDDGSWAIMVYDYVTPAESGDRYWQRLCRDEDPGAPAWQHDFLRHIAQLTARMHGQHLVQWDNHLDNFLVKHEQVFVIDSGGVQRMSRLSPAQATSNFALLMAQFPALDDADIRLMKSAYHDALPDTHPRLNDASLKRELQRQRRQRLADYLEKCQRDCTEVALHTPRAGIFMACRRALIGPELLAWGKSPQAQTESAERIKDGNSQTVAATHLDNRSVIIKRYNIKGVGHWLRRLGRPSRARNAWLGAHGLHLVRIATPQPVAFVEQAVGPLHGPAYYVAERLEGVTLDHALQQGLMTEDALTTQFAALCRTMICQRISHGDFKATNFIVQQGHLWVIDLDAVQFHRSDLSFSRAFRKDLDRFLRNWEHQPLLKDRLEAAIRPLYMELEALSGKRRA